MLKPIDLVVALKLAVNSQPLTQSVLAMELDLSVSQINRALKQCIASGLLDHAKSSINRKALLEFLIHGVKYAFPGKIGALSRGIPTAYSASPLAQKINSGSDMIVWPDPKGDARGESLKPIYRNVPVASRKDPDLYQALALIDAIRIGRARERKIAGDLLVKQISRQK